MKPNVAADQLKQTIDELASDYLEDELKHKEEEEEINEIIPDSERTIPDQNRDIEKEVENRDLVDGKDRNEVENRDVVDQNDEESLDLYRSYLEIAKDYLKQYLMNVGYSERSRSIILREFNTFLDDKEPFQDYRVNGEIGYSWVQIQNVYRKFGPICELARKLHSSSLSEASCERTISQQRLIYASRRKNSKRDLLDARLAIMNASVGKLAENRK